MEFRYSKLSPELISNIEMIAKHQALEILDSFSKEIPALYPKEVLDYRGRKVDAKSVEHYLTSERIRFAEVAALLPPPTQEGARLLDIGIAYGFLPALIQQLTSWECHGLEIEKNIPVYSSFAKAHGVTVHAGQLGTAPLNFSDGEFQAVLFSEVFEHLRLSPSLVFQELKRLLAKEGYLILTTPNMARLTNIVKLIVGKNPLEPFPDHVLSENITEHLVHIREYTMGELKDLFEKHGFRICRAYYSNCMERGRPHALLTALVPPWRGNLMILGQKI